MPRMSHRTPQQVGALVKARREALRLTQEDIEGVSSATVRKIEGGTAGSFRPSKIVALTSALGWPVDALDRLHAGEDPVALVHERPPPGDPSLVDRIDSNETRILVLEDRVAALERTIADLTPVTVRSTRRTGKRP